jgi:hypothetical protein
MAGSNRMWFRDPLFHSDPSISSSVYPGSGDACTGILLFIAHRIHRTDQPSLYSFYK